VLQFVFVTYRVADSVRSNRHLEQSVPRLRSVAALLLRLLSVHLFSQSAGGECPNEEKIPMSVNFQDCVKPGKWSKVYMSLQVFIPDVAEKVVF
jgi:hypothetical protein